LLPRGGADALHRPGRVHRLRSLPAGVPSAGNLLCRRCPGEMEGVHSTECGNGPEVPADCGAKAAAGRTPVSAPMREISCSTRWRGRTRQGRLRRGWSGGGTLLNEWKNTCARANFDLTAAAACGATVLGDCFRSYLAAACGVSIRHMASVFQEERA